MRWQPKTQKIPSAFNRQISLPSLLTAQVVLVIKGNISVEEAGEAIGEILGRIGSYLKTQGQNPTGAPFTRTFSHKDGMLKFAQAPKLTKHCTSR